MTSAPQPASTTKAMEVKLDTKEPSLLMYCGMCFAIGVLSYANTWNAGMVWDDRAVILNNQDVVGETTLSKIFSHDFWGAMLSNPSSHKSFRPVTILTFRANYLVFGPSPFSFHVVNALLHGTVSAAIVLLGNAFDWFELRSKGQGRLVGIVGGVLFAVHAVHTEAVASVVGRADVLCALFGILSMLSHMQAIVKFERYCRGVPNTDWDTVSPFFCLAGSYSFAWIAMLCKEQGIAVLGVNVLLDLLLQAFPNTLRSAASRRKRQSTGHQWLIVSRTSTLSRVGLTVVFLAILLGWRFQKHEGAPLRQWELLDNPATYAPSTISWALTIMYSHAMYLKLLILPIGLCYDHSLNAIPLVNTIFSSQGIEILGSYGMVVWALFASVQVLKRRSTGEQTESGIEPNYLPVIAVAFGIITMVPASNILFPIGTLVAERLLYVPSIGVCLLYGYFVSNVTNTLKHEPVLKQLGCITGVTPSRDFLGMALTEQQHAKVTVRKDKHVSQSPKRKKSPVRAMLLSLIVFWFPVLGNFTLTVLRNQDWQSEQTLFESAMHAEPNSARVLNNYAATFMGSKNRETLVKAKQLLQRAVHIYPQYGTALGNLGQVHRVLKEYFEAVDVLRQSLRYEDSCLSRAYLGDSLTQLALIDQSPPPFSNDDDIVPARGIRTLEDGSTRIEVMDIERAKSPSALIQGLYHLSYAIQAGCGYPFAFFTLGVCYAEQGDHERAIKLYNKSLEVNKLSVSHGIPVNTHVDEAKVSNMIGLSLSSLGQVQNAIEAFLHGIELSPNTTELLSNAASSYLKLAEKSPPQQGSRYRQRSLELLESALALDPGNPLLLNNIGWAYEQMGEYNQALKYYKEALHLLPNHETLKNNVKKIEDILNLLIVGN